MSVSKLKADIRIGNTKGSLRALRANGKVPGVIYGKDIEPQNIYVDGKELNQLVAAKGARGLLSLDVNNVSYNAMIKELQRDNLRVTLLHVDFNKVSLKDKIETKVPVALLGNPEGVKEGGIVQQQLRELEIKCLPTEIPESIEVDISKLKIGENITVGDLSVGVEILNSPGEIIATILSPPLAEIEEDAESAEVEEEKTEEE